MKAFCLMLLLLLCSSCILCQSSLLQPKGIYTSDFTIDEISRNITYYTPRNYGKKESYPLLVFLHDDTETAKSTIKKYGELIQNTADSADCVVMYPDAAFKHWNSKVAASAKDTINDAGFISIMIDYFIQQYGCNPDRIYIAGIGNGGDMCLRFNCESTSQPVAIAVVNTVNDKKNVEGCRTKADIPVLATREADIKTGIEKALQFLFAYPSHQPTISGK